MELGFNNCPVKTKPKPDTKELRALAAQGLNREQIAQALGIPYKRLCYFITTYYTLDKAFHEGVKEHKQNGKK